MFPLCRLCKEKVESVTDIASLCSVLAGNQYRKKHDKLIKMYIGSCAINLRLNVRQMVDKCDKCETKASAGNDKCKILGNFAIQTDKEL